MIRISLINDLSLLEKATIPHRFCLTCSVLPKWFCMKTVRGEDVRESAGYIPTNYWTRNRAGLSHYTVWKLD